MSFGSTAYASYARIRSESDECIFPDWTELSHDRRLAWEAAAQAVALAVLPVWISNDSDDADEDEKEDAKVDFDE